MAAPARFLDVVPYSAPAWCANTSLKVPSRRYVLGLLPTPVHQWKVPDLPASTKLYIKRDDLSGMDLSGNKVRKLEFLLADAVDKGYDSVITIGGIQSNHCRATAVAARYLGLDCHLILRTSKALVDGDPGLTGNLLLERSVGAHVHLVTKEEYTRVGSVALGEQLEAQLRGEGRKPYVVPVGGSNSLGMWGYLEAVREMEADLRELDITDIVMACGSGATTGGLALGVHLSGLPIKVHGYGVCDDEEYFYNFIDDLIEGMGGPKVAARDIVRVVQAKGSGYAISTDNELAAVQRIAHSTGILLDPVYSGKAAVKLFEEVAQQPNVWRDRNILFIHTGGLLGMYDKVPQLQQVLPAESFSRFQVSL